MNLEQYSREAQTEFESILSYWMNHTLDEENGGFYGHINTLNQVTHQAEKGLVLNARILWSFSAAYIYTQENKYAQIAERAYQYLIQHFKDEPFGGFYWSVDYLGQPFQERKQIYGQAFVVYALCEYYQCSQDAAALDQAIQLFTWIEKCGQDLENGGYWEALSRDWQIIEDVRLSEKDANEKKSMNTHLHVLEAYTNLYRVWPDEKLGLQIEKLLHLYQTRLIEPTNYYQHLFMDENWVVKSNIISYGHDIEASWLIWEAAEALGKTHLQEAIKPFVLGLAKTALKGIAQDGGMHYELHLETNHLDTDKHSWVQAEAAVGFLNAYQITGDQTYLVQSWKSWQFLQKYIVDHQNGEWHWGVTDTYQNMNDVKVGFWKCPYHSTRACLEVLSRIKEIS